MNLFEEMIWEISVEILSQPAEDRLVTVQASHDELNERAIEALEEWETTAQQRAENRKVEWAYKPEMVGHNPPINYYYDREYVSLRKELMVKRWISRWREEKRLEARFQRYEIPLSMREYLRVKYS